jgi:nucleoside-diphosphate-sugar epimerase
MSENQNCERIIDTDDLILVTGASGFIGSRVVARLLELGFRNLRCFVRSSCPRIEEWTAPTNSEARVEVFRGNLLSPADCARATADAALILHLAAGRGEKSYPDAFLNSVVTTRNLIEASLRHGMLRRFVSVSSFAVYSNTDKKGRLLDESGPVETRPELRGDAYTFAKVKQEELVAEYGKTVGMPYVIVRPGHVYGAGNEGISGRIGINTFGVFLHLGGSNRIPLTFVDNCADAIILAGLKPGIDGEAFNIVDDDLPSSRRVLRLYKKSVKHFTSLYIPHMMSYGLCYLWERYSSWSEAQLPPVFNRRRWHAMWKKTSYSNEKLKGVGWTPRISMNDGLERYFAACRGAAQQ